VASSHYMSSNAPEMILVPLQADGSVGESFELHPGRFKIGAGEGDDIYLADVGVAPEHVKLIYLDGRITILGADHEVRVNGQVQKNFPFDLEPGHVLTLGSAHLSYGAPDTEWPGIPQIEVEAEEVDEEEEEELPAPPPPVKRTVKEKAVLSARRGAIVVGSAVGLIVLAILFDFIFGTRNVVSPNDRAIGQAYTQLQELLKSDKNFATVKLEKRIDGAISVTGFIDDEQSARLLADQIRNQAILTKGNVRYDAMSKDKLSDLIKDTIGNFPLKYNLTLSGNDIFLEITGIKTPDLDTDHLRNELSRIDDRVAPRKFRYEITTIEPADLIKAVNAKLIESPLTRNLKFEVQNNTAVIKGVVAASAEEQTLKQVRKITEGLMSTFPVTVDITTDPKVNFQVSSVMTGGSAPAVAYISQRGKTERFSVGDEVFGVGELLEIRKDGVIVSSRSKELFVPVY
jgi:hypothetical protein